MQIYSEGWILSFSCVFAVIHGALPCTSNFLHPRHSTVPCIMQSTSVFAISAMHVDRLQLGSPSSGLCLEHVQLFRAKYSPEIVAHRACLSVKLNMYPSRQFLAYFVVHMPLCLHVLFRVARPLHRNRGGGGG